MTTLAHIVNPVLVAPASDLYRAQPITFETMRRARAVAAATVEVTLWTAQYAEDRPVIPPDFGETPDLQRSVLDTGSFARPRKLPLLGDILDRLYEATDADFLIFTNVDIALQPHFYLAVHELVEQGCDSFVINRRTLAAHYREIAQLPAMYADRGKPHRGWDCFVYPRAIYPHFKLGKICVGATRVGLALLANMISYSASFRELRDRQLTFHIGDERSWLEASYADYNAHNTRELMGILQALEAEGGRFDRHTIPGQFLLRKRAFGPLYEFWSRYVYLPPAWSQALNRLAGRR